MRSLRGAFGLAVVMCACSGPSDETPAPPVPPAPVAPIDPGAVEAGVECADVPAAIDASDSPLALGPTTTSHACTTAFRATLPRLATDEELVERIFAIAGYRLPPAPQAQPAGCGVSPSHTSDVGLPFHDEPDADAEGTLGRVKRVGDALLTLRGRRLQAIGIGVVGAPKDLGSLTIPGLFPEGLMVSGDRAYVFARALEGPGVTVHSVRVGKDALTLLESISIDAVGTDVRIVDGRLVLLVRSSPLPSFCTAYDQLVRIPSLTTTPAGLPSSTRKLFAATDVVAAAGAPPTSIGLQPSVPMNPPGEPVFETVLGCGLLDDGRFDCRARTLLLPTRFRTSPSTTTVGTYRALGEHAVIGSGDFLYAVSLVGLDVAVHKGPPMGSPSLRAINDACDRIDLVALEGDASVGVRAVRIADFDDRGDQALPSAQRLDAPSFTFVGANVLSPAFQTPELRISAASPPRSTVVPFTLEKPVDWASVDAVDATRALVAWRTDKGVFLPFQVDVAADPPTVRPLAPEARCSRARGGWCLATSGLESCKGGGFRKGAIFTRRDTLAPAGVVRSRKILDGQCVAGCSDPPLTILAGGRGFELFSGGAIDELIELRLGETVARLGASLPLTPNQ